MRQFALGLALVIVGCQQGSSPAAIPPEARATAPETIPGETTATPAAPTATALPSAAGTAEASAAASGSAAPTASAAPEAASSATPLPKLLDEAGQPLPQTEDRPSTSSEFFKHLASTLFTAMQKDDPSLAKGLFFPIEAYRQVKAIAKPERDYERRLIANFERDIHKYHKLLGPNPENAKLVELAVPEDRARWMKPGSEGNKLGYFRVLRSRLRFADGKGKERELEITSLISWRGEWYVVHIHGFE
ncbi:MAG: hypothetical protein R3B13_06505 [Polyangiaceae bacterium]